jgi:hypothetical protein
LVLVERWEPKAEIHLHLVLQQLAVALVAQD